MNKADSAQPHLIYPKRKLYLDYLAGRKQLAPFYRCYPANPRTLSSKVDELLSFEVDRVRLSEALVQYNRDVSAGPATIENARLLADPQTLAVLTGQQPGFVGGPLYNIYKAVTAIKLAAHLSRTTGKNVVPVFWIASEDANTSEIDHTSFVDHRGQFRRIRLDLPDTGRQISSLRAAPNVLIAFNELMDLLPATDRRAKWQQVYQPHDDEPWGQWFGRIYAQLFGDYGLVLLEPHIVYPHAGEIFKRILSRFTDLQPAFDTATSALSQLAYTPQISSQSRVSLYVVRDGQRQLITSLQADYDPADLSCSVMFRPVVQDFLFPAVAYVAGPGEIAYFAQLTSLYRQLDVPMPVIWPRASMTLASPDITALLEGSVLTALDFLSQAAPGTPDEHLTKSQFQHILLNFRPKSQPQERLFSLLPYLVYYGQPVLNRIVEQTDVFDFRHRIVYLPSTE